MAGFERRYREKERPESVILSDSKTDDDDDAKKAAGDAKTQDPPPKGKEEGDGKGKEDEKLVAQSKVDEIVGQTRTQARETAEKKMLERLGITDEETLIAELKAARVLKESQMSDTEKAQAEIKRLEADAAKATELAKENQKLSGILEATLKSRLTALEPPDYLKTLMEDMEPAMALEFLSQHEAEITEAKAKPPVPKTGAGGKGKKKALTDEEKKERREEIARTYGID